MFRRFSQILFLTILALSYAQKTESDSINWKTYEKAKKLSKDSGRPIYFYIYSNSCGWCRRFVQQTLQDSIVLRKLNSKFIPVKINSSSTEKQKVDGKEVTERQLAAMFAIRGVPTSAFMDSEGKLITKLPGYIPPAQFLSILNYIGDGWYKDMEYQEYIESEEKLKNK